MLWIFSSLVGTWAQSSALVVREISSGIKMDTDNESLTVILLFAERVHGKMRHNANNVGQASWRGKRSSPSSSWSSSFFSAWSSKLSLLYDYLISLPVHPLLFVLHKERMEKCGIKPTMPRKLADEVNDPFRHHHHQQHLPEVVSAACFITVIWYIYSFTPNYPLKKGHAHLKKGWKCLSSCVEAYIDDFGLA